MRLEAKKLDIESQEISIFLKPKIAESLSLHAGDRVQVKSKNQQCVAEVSISSDFLSNNQAGLPKILFSILNSPKHVAISPIFQPKSLPFIIKKLKGYTLSRSELFTIVSDIAKNILSEAEIAYFVSGVFERGMSQKETIYLTEAMYKTGKALHWKNKIVADKHCVGGIAGNRTTPIVVSICAAIGIIMPKTSSRAITSAAGTADTIEAIANVDFTLEEIQRIVEKTGACLAWGGALGLAPADDKLIRVERLLNVDPQSQLIASIMAKKLAAGSTHVLIDIPYGEYAKVSESEALQLKKKFLEVSRHFKIHLQAVLTDGSQPIGKGIGPILEMQDVLKVLEQKDSPKDLEEKSLFLSGLILEMVGKSKKGEGRKTAEEILYSGKAHEKFIQIIETQGKKSALLCPAKCEEYIYAEHTGKVRSIDNNICNLIARYLGCPVDKAAGIFLHVHNGQEVKAGDCIMTFYAETPQKIQDAKLLYQHQKPIVIKND